MKILLNKVTIVLILGLFPLAGYSEETRVKTGTLNIIKNHLWYYGFQVENRPKTSDISKNISKIKQINTLDFYPEELRYALRKYSIKN